MSVQRFLRRFITLEVHGIEVRWLPREAQFYLENSEFCFGTLEKIENRIDEEFVLRAVPQPEESKLIGHILHFG